MAPSIARNIASNWLSLIVTGSVGLVVAPFVIKNLGPEQYGCWAIIVSLCGQFMIFDFGVRNALVKFVADASARKDDQAINRTLSAALVILLVIAAAVLLVSFGLSYYLPQFARIPEHLTTIALAAFALAAFDAALELVGGVIDASLAGRERYDLISLANSVRSIGNGIVLIAILFAGGGMIGVAATALVARTAVRVWLLVKLHREIPSLEFSPRHVTRAELGEIIRYGLWAFAVVASNRIIFSIDVLIVGYLAGPVVAGMFAVCTLLIDEVRQIAQSATTVLTPRFSAIRAADDRDREMKLLLDFTRWMQCGGMMILVPLVATGGAFLNLFAGPTYGEAHPWLVILAVPFFICLPAYLFTSYLYALSKHQLTAKLLLTEAVLKLAASIVLGIYYGPLGVAIGTAVPAAFIRGIAMPFAVAQLTGLPLGAYWRQITIRPVMLACIMAIGIAIGFHFFGLSTWSGWIATNTLGVAAYAAAAPGLALTAREQRSILNRVLR